jgi:uncharacterized protein YndB with AHSA1/START domain
MPAHPEKESTDQDNFVISRSFAAPITLLFDVWTDPLHFSQWLPPKGFAMEFIKADIKSGGSCFYAMSGPDGKKMYGRINYLEIQKPDRLVYTQQFCDENEKISRHPFAPTWPETMLTTIVFTKEGPNQTKVTLICQPYGDVSPEETDTFVKGKSSMTQGWTGSFDKLDIYLHSHSSM